MTEAIPQPGQADPVHVPELDEYYAGAPMDAAPLSRPGQADPFPEPIMDDVTGEKQMIPMLFKRTNSPYREGEIAGITEPHATRLELRGIATRDVTAADLGADRSSLPNEDQRGPRRRPQQDPRGRGQEEPPEDKQLKPRRNRVPRSNPATK